MNVIKLNKEKFVELNVLMLASTNILMNNNRVKVLSELLKYLEPEGCIVRSESRIKIMNELRLLPDTYKHILYALDKEGHIRVDGDIIWPHPKYVAIAKGDGNLLITTK